MRAPIIVSPGEEMGGNILFLRFQIELYCKNLEDPGV